MMDSGEMIYTMDGEHFIHKLEVGISMKENSEMV